MWGITEQQYFDIVACLEECQNICGILFEFIDNSNRFDMATKEIRGFRQGLGSMIDDPTESLYFLYISDDKSAVENGLDPL